MSRSRSHDVKMVERARGGLARADLLVLEAGAVVFTPVARTELVNVAAPVGADQVIPLLRDARSETAAR